jgi:hypothetical protein
VESSVRPAASTPSPSGSGKRHHLVDTAVVVTVLGVLPVAWDAPVAWQVLGPAACVPVVGHSLLRVWREVFSTDPRHLDAAR